MMQAVRTTHGFCSFLARGDDATSLRAATAALTHTSAVPLPAKLVLARGRERPELRVETFDDTGADTLSLAFEADAHYWRLLSPRESGPCCPPPWLIDETLAAARAEAIRNGRAAEVAATTALVTRLRGDVAEALAAADWVLAPQATDAVAASVAAELRTTPPFKAARPVTLAATSEGFVRVALGVDVVRAGHELADAAVRLFALQASARLTLARPTVATQSAKRRTTITIGWDALVPADPASCERTAAAISHAAAATSIARELTFETFDALAASEHAAHAYLRTDSRFDTFLPVAAGAIPSARRPIAAEATPPATAA